jgi:plastocyanin
VRRSPLIVSLLILALFLIACGESATKPIAASSPRPTASVPRGEAMEKAESCPRRWPPPPCAKTEAEGKRARTAAEIYYFNIDAEGSRFVPASFALSISHQIELINNDSVRHNVTIPASGITMDVEPGANDYTRPITLTPGQYQFFCRFHRAEGMRGVFTMSSSKDIVTLRRGY